jgi:hypothetical protein
MARKFCKKLKFYEEATKGPMRPKPVRKIQPIWFAWTSLILSVGGHPLPDGRKAALT